MSATYIISDGEKYLQLEDGSRVPVVAPLSLDSGSRVALIAAQEALLTAIDNKIAELLSSQGSNWERLQAASDRAQSITYHDAGTVNERIAVITYTSASLNLSATETFTYAGSDGSYRLTGIARS